MSVLTNVMIQIHFPPGFSLVDGSMFHDGHNITVISRLEPYYSSTDLVRLEGGVYLGSLDDMTVAAMIYIESKEADTLTYARPQPPDPGDPPDSPKSLAWNRFVYARQRYVTLHSAAKLLINVFDLMLTRGIKRLGNFEIQKLQNFKVTGAPNKYEALMEEAKQWLLAVQSAGSIGKGGRPKFAMVEPNSTLVNTPGRLWMVTGMGANTAGWPLPSADPRLPPMRFFSPAFFIWRAPGRYMPNIYPGSLVLRWMGR